jgi:hypothetical protein
MLLPGTLLSIFFFAVFHSLGFTLLCFLLFASGSRKMNVLASSMTKQTSAVLGQSLFAAAVTHQAGVTYNRIFYSFDQANAKYIFWDPSVGYGMPALAPTQTVWSAMVISLVVAFSLLAVGSARAI